MAITTFPAILSQIGDGSIFVKISKGVYPLQIFTKIDPSQIWLKIAGKVVYAISSNSSNKIGHFWAHFGPFFGVRKFFSHFLATRWGRGGLETSKMDSPCQKTPILTPHTYLYSVWGRNGGKTTSINVVYLGIITICRYTTMIPNVLQYNLMCFKSSRYSIKLFKLIEAFLM